MKEYPILFNGEAVRAILEGRKTQTRRPISPQPSTAWIPDDVRYSDDTPFWWLCWDADIPPTMRRNVWGQYSGSLWATYQVADCSPHGAVGDRLWVRETFILEDTDEVPTDGRPHREMEEPGEFGQLLVPHYRATEPEPHIVPLDLSDGYDDRTRWYPSIFMPRWASRILLENTDVRVQQVQDITDDDAWEESAWWWMHDDAAGPPFYVRKGYNVECFSELWDSLYAKPKPAYRDKQIVYYVSHPWEAGTETREHRGLPWYVYGNPWVFVIDFRRIRL